MLRGKQIVCLSSINWEFNWQGHQEIMARFAAAGNTVLYVENTGIRTPHFGDWPRLWQRLLDWRKGAQGIREVRERLYVCSPVLLPFPYSRVAQWINRWLFTGVVKRWMRLLGVQRPILWAFLPTRFTLDLISQLDPELVVYYCIADFEQVGPRKKIQRAERRLLERADVVFAQGEVLAHRCRRYARGDVAIFPFGVNLERFDELGARPLPGDLDAIKRPRVGYVGALQRHVDGPLLSRLAERHPEWNFVIVGPQVGEFTHELKASNVHQLGARAHEDIPAYIAGFDVCLIPYRLNDYTQTVYPTKLTEYLVLGKPVVSTPLPEVVAFNERHGSLVAIGQTPEEFEQGIREGLREPVDGAARRRIEVARRQGWSSRLEAMSQIIEQRLLECGRLRSTQWAQLLRRYYRRAARRILTTTAAIGFVYLGMFHTPLLWWAAAPLKIQEAPRPADAIVVFAGGVGESGRAGQGYEERVLQAVALYERGLAPRIIFSSGLTFLLREADVMKALAVSLGVPEEAILLEREAASTVQNVAHTRAMLRAHDWKTILLVSSPYHMRRADLVWRKQAPEVTVIKTPVPVSGFYGQGTRVQPQQVEGILHEYLGLLYYWWKGEI